MNENKSSDENNQASISRIEKELISVNPKIFEGVNQQKKHQILKGFAFTMQKIHIGPLPSPETLREYSDLFQMVQRELWQWQKNSKIIEFHWKRKL